MLGDLVRHTVARGSRLFLARRWPPVIVHTATTQLSVGVRCLFKEKQKFLLRSRIALSKVVVHSHRSMERSWRPRISGLVISD